MPASHFDVNSMTGRPKFIVRHSTYLPGHLRKDLFVKESLKSLDQKTRLSPIENNSIV
jgi:hypothetical protein